MSFNPGEFTEQLGQKVGEYAAAYFSKGKEGGGGFIAETQQKFLREQVGNFVTTEINQVFHIQKTDKHHNPTDPNKPSGGVMGGVTQMLGHGDELPTEENIPPSERIGNKKEGGGLFEQAKEFAERAFGGEDAGSLEKNIPTDNRVGQAGYKPRDAYTIPQNNPNTQNQGGFQGENRNYGDYEPNQNIQNQGGNRNYGGNQNYPSGGGGGYTGSDNIPSDQRIGQNYGNQQQGYGGQGQGGSYGNQGGYGGQQQQGGYGGQQQQGGYGGQQRPGEFYGNQQQQQGQGGDYEGQQQGYGGQQGGYGGQQQQGQGYYGGQQQQGGYGQQQNPNYPYNQVEGSYQ